MIVHDKLLCIICATVEHKKLILDQLNRVNLALSIVENTIKWDSTTAIKLPIKFLTNLIEYIGNPNLKNSETKSNA
jgi:hypothetical protein